MKPAIRLKKLDYPQFAEVVQGLSKLVISLANKP